MEARAFIHTEGRRLVRPAMPGAQAETQRRKPSPAAEPSTWRARSDREVRRRRAAFESVVRLSTMRPDPPQRLRAPGPSRREHTRSIALSAANTGLSYASRAREITRAIEDLSDA